MITVNPVYVNYVLDPLTGGADNEESLEIYGHYRPDEEVDVKKLASDVLLSEYKKKKEILQRVIKDSLAYYLSYPDKINFESIFNSLLLPLDTPKNGGLFFQWI